jgi:hypothetical protein
MTKDIPESVEQETDAVAQRIFDEWPKWFDGADDPRRLQLRDWQNELLALREKAKTEELSEEQKLELKENQNVITKKIRKHIKELLAEHS